MKSKKSLLAYLIVWALLLLYFWVGIKSDDALFFSMLMITVLPIMTAILSFNVGKKDTTAIKIATVIGCGIMYMLMPFLTFDLLNTLTFHHANYPEPLVAGMGAIISLLFVLIGMLVTYLHNCNNSGESQENQEQNQNQ